MKTRITKIDAAKDARYRTATNEEYKPGQFNGLVAPPIEYTVLGVLASPVEVGFPILLDREERNGVKVDGAFMSSRVLEFDGKVAKTLNSVYLIQDV